MKYYKKQIVIFCALFAVFFVFVCFSVVAFVYVIINELGFKGIFVTVLMLLFFGMFALGSIINCVNMIAKDKEVRKSGLLDTLNTINPYSTQKEMLTAFAQEKQKKIYDDQKIIITENFLGTEKSPMLIDGILDAKIVVHKTNFMVEKIVLSFLYYNGEKVSFTYRRPLGPSGGRVMENRLKQIEGILSWIARRGKNFRKYECCQL